MKSRLLVFLLMALVVIHISGSGLQADSTEIWNTGNLTTISHNTFPQIKGNCLVWQAWGGLEGATSGPGDWEIFLYDIDSQVVIQVTDDNYNDISPQTDGIYVVWQKQDTSRSNQIFLYEVHGENPPGGRMISNDDNRDNYSPQIAAGRVVWTSQLVAHSFQPGEIMLYDAKNLSGPDSISDNTSDCSFPRIDSETVLWVQIDENGTETLFIYDLTSENPEPEPAPRGFGWAENPQVDGDLTVITRDDGTDREIFVYSKSGRYHQITDNDVQDRHPSISGNYVTWMADGEIFLAEISLLPSLLVSISPDTIVVEGRESIIILVRNEIGEKVHGATVTLSGCGVAETKVTNRKGRVKFKKVNPSEAGTIEVTVIKEGYSEYIGSVTVNEAEFKVEVWPRKIKLAMLKPDKGKRIKVTVTNNSSKKRVEGAQVAISGCGVNETHTTDSHGKAVFEGILPTETGTIQVFVSKDGYITDDNASIEVN